MRSVNQEIYDHLMSCNQCNRPHYTVFVGPQYNQRPIALFADSDEDAIRIAKERSGEDSAEIDRVYTPQRRLIDAAIRCVK